MSTEKNEIVACQAKLFPAIKTMHALFLILSISIQNTLFILAPNEVFKNEHVIKPCLYVDCDCNWRRTTKQFEIRSVVEISKPNVQLLPFAQLCSVAKPEKCLAPT